MKTVHIYVHTTVRGRATAGTCGYVLALEKDGDIVSPVKHIFHTEKKTTQGALLETLAKAVTRIREAVVLHIWTDEQLIASAITQGWVEKWAAEEWKGRKNADEWREFLSITKRKGIDVRGIWFNVRQAHPFREWLRWECEKANKEGNHGEKRD